MENNELKDLDFEKRPLLQDNTDQDFEDSVLDNEPDEIDITDMGETSFINPNFKDFDTTLEDIKRPENQPTKAVENFIRLTNPDFRFENSDREIKFRLNLGLKEKSNNITYKPLLENNERGKPQIVLKRSKGKLFYNTSKSSQEAVEQFKHEIDMIIYEKNSEKDEFYDSSDFLDTTADVTNITGLSPQENRELQGVLKPFENTSDRLGDDGVLQRQANHFQELLNKTVDQRDATDNPEEFIELEERVVGLREAVNRTISQRSNEETKNNQILDLERLEKFKKWSKENLVALSGVAIAIGGIITSIIIGGRTVIQKGAQATNSFVKTLAKIAKDLGPIGSTILNLVGTVLKWGVKGISFLANNLWILALALTWFVYDIFKNKRKQKK